MTPSSPHLASTQGKQSTYQAAGTNSQHRSAVQELLGVISLRPHPTWNASPVNPKLGRTVRFQAICFAKASRKAMERPAIELSTAVRIHWSVASCAAIDATRREHTSPVSSFTKGKGKLKTHHRIRVGDGRSIPLKAPAPLKPSFRQANHCFTHSRFRIGQANLDRASVQRRE